MRDVTRSTGRAIAASPPAGAPLPSITRRLTFALGGIALVVFAVASVVLDWSLTAEIRHQERSEATGQLAMIRHFLESRPDRVDARRDELDEMLASHPELRVWVTAQDGRALYGGEPPATIAQRNGLRVLRAQEGALRGLQERIDTPGRLAGATVLVALDTTAREQLIVEHRTTLVLVSVLATALIAVSTAWATGRGLAPVAALSRHAARITPHAPGTRLPLDGTVRELHDLAQAFNEVLDRLEDAYRRLDAFNADVAHELRTPLATMINGTQVTLAASRTHEELRETLLSNLEELEALKRLVNDMLFLARADRRERLADRAPVALAAEALAVAEYFDAATQEAGVGLRVSGDATIEGNRELIRRAVANLLSNAVRHTPRGRAIEIVIEDGADAAVLRVRNPGHTIPADALPHIFDRFFRVDDATTRGHEGSGLGLAIVRAIAHMHDGDVFASSADGLTEVGFSARRGTPMQGP